MKDSEILALIKERIESGRTAELTVTGNSMAPLFKHGKTHVTLCPAENNIKKYCIALYTRENGDIVIHRYVGKNGDYMCFRGDNELYTERDILPENVCAVVSFATTDGKTVSLCGFKQRAYGFMLNVKHNIKRMFRAVKRRVKRKK